MKDVLQLLIVDDDEVDRMATRRALKGHVVHEASSVASAVKVLRERPIDVVLLDYFIPPDTAPDALARLRAVAPSVPALILSGQGSEEVVAEVLRAGAADYLPKTALSEPRRLALLVERTHAAAELRHEHELAQARLALALTASGADVWSVDKDRTAVTGGPRFFQFFALSDELAETPYALWRGQFSPADAERLDEALAGETISFQAKVSSGRWVELRGRRDARGSAFGTVSDVTENREAELRNLGLKDRLMGIASHDLKNPLSAVRMGAKLLAKSERLTDADRRVVSHISTSAERMTRLVSQLLDLTRVRLGGELPLTPTELDLDQLVDALIEEAVLASGRHFERHLTPVKVHADPDRLGQVVSNLLGNAITHGDAAKSIVVRVHAADGLARVEVENAGAPIPPELMDTLFEPFVQARTATRDGLGLGLFISREVMRAHDGTLSVSSTADGVTRFTAELPQKTDAAQ